MTNTCGAAVSDPASLTVYCRADWNRDGSITPADVAVFVNDWFSDLVNGTMVADYDGNGVIQPADVGVFVTDWFNTLTTGC